MLFLMLVQRLLGQKKKKHRDWFDDNDEELLKLVSEYRAAFINWQQLLHDDMTAAVLYNGKSSEPFSVDAGVKQGCVIAPTLFLLFTGAVLQLARPSLNDGVGIQYRLDGNIFNLRRLQAKTKVSFTTIVELQYADDSAVCSCSEDRMQSTVDAFALAYSRLGLTLNISKTETMFQHE